MKITKMRRKLIALMGIVSFWGGALNGALYVIHLVMVAIKYPRCFGVEQPAYLPLGEFLPELKLAMDWFLVLAIGLIFLWKFAEYLLFDRGYETEERW